MNKSLSEDSLDLLRDMVRSEAWNIFETLQKEKIQDSRALALTPSIMIEDPRKSIYHAGIAQGREDSITELKDLLYDTRSKSNS